jgi:hypothetical protein
MAPQFDRALRDLLRAAGCAFVRQGLGSHEIWRCLLTRRNFTVPVGIPSRPYRQCHPAPSRFAQGVLSGRGPDRCVRYVSRVRLRGALRTYTARRQHQQLSTRPGKSLQMIDRKANGLSRTPPRISSEVKQDVP